MIRHQNHNETTQYFRTTFSVTKGQTTSDPEKQTNVVYKINCADCYWSYIGDTRRALETRKEEHKRNVRQCKSGSNIAKHAWTQDHKINFDECKILDKATYRRRATLESWHTATTLNSDNNAHLPEQYRFLLKKNRS
jgi:hypothetical protein